VNLTPAGNFEFGIHFVVDEAGDEAGVGPGVVLGVHSPSTPTFQLFREAPTLYVFRKKLGFLSDFLGF
jgi:hypothetical protein